MGQAQKGDRGDTRLETEHCWVLQGSIHGPGLLSILWAHGWKQHWLCW